MLASTFVAGGVESLRNPESLAKAAEPLADLVSHRLPQLPLDAQTLVRIHGGVNVGAGTAFALGRFPRLNALMLAGSLVPATWGGHRFWEESEPQRRAEQQFHFLRNVGLAGGLLFAAIAGRKRSGPAR